MLLLSIKYMLDYFIMNLLSRGKWILLAIFIKIARRGQISTIVTDNGTNFVGASNYFKNIMHTNNEIAGEITCKFDLKWNIITPRDPHHIYWNFAQLFMFRSEWYKSIKSVQHKFLMNKKIKSILFDWIW